MWINLCLQNNNKNRNICKSSKTVAMFSADLPGQLGPNNLNGTQYKEACLSGHPGIFCNVQLVGETTINDTKASCSSHHLGTNTRRATSFPKAQSHSAPPCSMAFLSQTDRQTGLITVSIAEMG